MLVLLASAPLAPSARGQSGYPPQDLNGLVQRASALMKEGRNKEALPIAQQALAAVRNTRGPESFDMAKVLLLVAELNKRLGAYSVALPYARAALAIDERQLGPGSINLAEAVGYLAEIVRLSGDKAGAVPLARRALDIVGRNVPHDDVTYAGALLNLGEAYEANLQKDQAEPLFRQALAIKTTRLGPDHPQTAVVAFSLGTLLEDRGDSWGAEPLFRQALAGFEKKHDDNATAATLNALATLLQHRGDHAGAEPMLRRAIAIAERALGPKHVFYGTLLLNLGELVRDRGDYGEAETDLLKALAVFEQSPHADASQFVTALDNLAALRQLFIGPKQDTVEQLLRRALSIAEKEMAPNDPHTAYPLNNLAEILMVKGDFTEAETYFRRALALRERDLGPSNGTVISIKQNLSTLLMATGRPGAALDYAEAASEGAETLIETLLAAGSSREKSAFFATIERTTESFVSLHTRELPRDPRACRLALTTVLRVKGRVLDAEVDALRAVRERATPEDAQRLDRLGALRATLASQSFAGSDSSGPDRSKRLEALRLEAEGLEKSLGDRYRKLSRPARRVTMEAVQRELRPGTALVEWLRYSPFDPDKNGLMRIGAPRYAAYVLRPYAASTWTDLGEAAPIEALVSEARRAFASPEGAFARVVRKLDDALMRPVRPLLGGSRDVYLSPDGALNLLPFGALVDESGRFLAATYRFTYLTSGRDLLRPLVAATSPPVIIAGPDYGGRAATPSPADRSIDLGDVTFPPLPGTLEEGHALAGLLRESKLYTAADATEALVKSLRGPAVVHLATHGFFLDAPLEPGSTERSPVRGLKVVRAKPVAEPTGDPLLRSGLALAGANLRRSGGEDGILTALEVSGLDLSGTKLVVLSACETGLGTPTRAGGVAGLRRSFALAGAETQVMSLWKIPDDATRALMVQYYKRLADGDGRSNAMREAQLVLMSSKTQAHPFFWAGFIVAGNDRSLAGKAPPPLRAPATEQVAAP